jgi:hypothetical protein
MVAYRSGHTMTELTPQQIVNAILHSLKKTAERVSRHPTAGEARPLPDPTKAEDLAKDRSEH